MSLVNAGLVWMVVFLFLSLLCTYTYHAIFNIKMYEAVLNPSYKRRIYYIYTYQYKHTKLIHLSTIMLLQEYEYILIHTPYNKCSNEETSVKYERKNKTV